MIEKQPAEKQVLYNGKIKSNNCAGKEKCRKDMQGSIIDSFHLPRNQQLYQKQFVGKTLGRKFHKFKTKMPKKS